MLDAVALEGYIRGLDASRDPGLYLITNQLRSEHRSDHPTEKQVLVILERLQTSESVPWGTWSQSFAPQSRRTEACRQTPDGPQLLYGSKPMPGFRA